MTTPTHDSNGPAWGAYIADDLAADLIIEEVGSGQRQGELHVQVRPSHVAGGAPAVYDRHKGPLVGKPWPLEMEGIDLDWFQAAASRCNERCESVLVAAPTSAGKTVVAVHAVQRCLDIGATCAYTAPVKALSNQKFLEFSDKFGADKVCLLTGDVTAGNPDSASIVVMTTEVLVSMLHRGASLQQSGLLERLHTVVFDEVHYIADEERGTAWEEAILLLERNVCLVCLSATVDNYVELAGWLAQTQHAPCHAVFTKYRPVPLEHRIFPCPAARASVTVADAEGRFQKKGLTCLQNLPTGGGKPDEDRRGHEVKALLEECRKQNDLPVLVFSFSRAECARFARELAVNVKLPADKAREVKERVQELLAKPLKKEDQQLQSIRECADYLLPRGVGMHHGGLLPILREVTELLFKEGLIKVLFTTETFALGVNMPSKAVIFNFASGREFRKFDGHEVRRLKAGEYIQISGRAGRRGIDERGRAISMVSHSVPVGFLQKLVKGHAEKVESRFKLSYGLILRCLRWSRGTLELVLMQSLKQFQSRQVEPVLHEEEENKLALLRELGLIDASFKLTTVGEAAANVHVATDDLVAIGLLLDGVVDDPGTDSDTFIAFLSCLVNDTEESEEVQTPPEFDPLWSRCEQQVQRMGGLQRKHGLEALSDDARLRKIRSCSGMAEAVLLWQQGKTFAEASIAAGGPEQDGLLARVLRRTHALAREFELALRRLGEENQADKVKEAHHRLHRGGRDFRSLPFLESIYLPVAIDPNTLEKETLRKATTPCPHQAGSEIMIDPANVGFSHISVARRFRDGHTIGESVLQLLQGGRKRDIAHEMVEVYWVDGQYFTLANRRLSVFRLFAQHCPERGREIKVRVVDEARARAWHWERKFTTGLWRGWRARVRGTGELIGRTAAETTFNINLPDVSLNMDLNSSETGFARASKDMRDDGTSDEDGEEESHAEASDQSDAEDDGACDADESLIIEDNSIVINPRRVIEFVLERELGNDTPRCLSVPASTGDLLHYNAKQEDGMTIPDRCANVHEYMRNFALPMLDELRADLKSKLEPRELKSEDLRRAERVRLVPYSEALRQAQKGDVPRLPKSFPSVGGVTSSADAVVLGDCQQAASLAPYQVVVLFEQGSVRRVTAITDAGAPAMVPGLDAEPGGLQVDHDDCYRFGVVYTTPKSKQAVVCVGRKASGPISARHRFELNYPHAAAAANDIKILRRGLIKTAQEVRDGGLAANAGVKPGFIAVEMEGWDGDVLPLAIAQASGVSAMQMSPGEAHPVRIVFEGEERKWCFVPLGCNANTNVRVAEALATPDLHHPIFWQNTISGNPLGDSSAWSGVSENQCTSLANDSEYDQDLRAVGLNDSQRAAIVQVVTCSDGVRLIQGPPGTGKTQTLVVLLDLTAKLGFEEQVNRCLVCAPTNIAVREIAQRLVDRLTARSTFTKALLSQVALIATEDRAKISNVESDLLSQVLLDHRKKRIKRVARFWLAERFDDCGREHLKQLHWVRDGVDPLTALLVEMHHAHHLDQCSGFKRRLSEFVRSALVEIKKRTELQKQQLEADFPFGTTVFELPPRSRAEAKAQRLERRIYEDLCRLKRALASFAGCLERFLSHLREDVAAFLDSCKAAHNTRAEAAKERQTVPESVGSFSKHSREAACRWAPLAARSDPDAVEGLMTMLGLSYREQANVDDGPSNHSAETTNVPKEPSEEDLKRALNKFRLLIHPDKAPAEMQTLATESFKYLDDAFHAVRRRACSKSSGTAATDHSNRRKREERSRSPGPIDEALQEEAAKTALQNLEAALGELQDASLYVRSAQSAALRNTCLRRCVLVMSTVTVAGRSSVAGQRIPTLFVDEACQSCEAETLIALRSDVQRLFLIGDPRQLPATVSSSLAKHAKYERSMFERLESIRLTPLMLNEQYRMKPSILVWSNEAFYNNDICTAESVLLRNRNWIDRMGLDRLTKNSARSRHELGSFRLFNTAGKDWKEEPVGHSMRNVSEGRYLLSLLFSFIRICPADFDVTIGIITPYRAQVEFFEEQLAEQAGKSVMVDRLRNCITVATVDGFQGNERDIIAISAVRSGNGQIGFSGDERRLNVAVTRAKQHVWIVGDLQTLEHGPSAYGALEERSNVWQQLIPFSRERGWVIDIDQVSASPSSGVAEPTESWAYDLCKEGPWMEMRMCPGAGYPCPWCLLCSCWADYGHIQSRAHLNARHRCGVEFARRRSGIEYITIDLHLEPDETDSGVAVTLQTDHGLIDKWICVENIAEGSALHRYNINAQPQLEVQAGTWILEANGVVDVAEVQAALAGAVDVELTVAKGLVDEAGVLRPRQPPPLPALPPMSPHENTTGLGDEVFVPCYVDLDRMNPWYKRICADGPWIKPCYKDDAVHLRCELCGAWADESHLESRRHKEARCVRGPGFVQTCAPPPPPPGPPAAASAATGSSTTTSVAGSSTGEQASVQTSLPRAPVNASMTVSCTPTASVITTASGVRPVTSSQPTSVSKHTTRFNRDRTASTPTNNAEVRGSGAVQSSGPVPPPPPPPPSRSTTTIAHTRAVGFSTQVGAVASYPSMQPSHSMVAKVQSPTAIRSPVMASALSAHPPYAAGVLRGPLKPGNVLWLSFHSGPLLCIADDGSPEVQSLWQCAHGEMECVLEDIAQIEHCDPGLRLFDRNHEIAFALSGTEHESRHFCVATGKGMAACGIGDRKQVRERVAKAAIAVAVHLQSSFNPPRLHLLLPLAKQCAAAAPQGQSTSMPSGMSPAPARARQPPPAPPQMQSSPKHQYMDRSLRPPRQSTATPPAQLMALVQLDSPLPSDNIIWPPFSFGRILCIADDHSDRAQSMWRCADDELQYALQYASSASILHQSDPQTKSSSWFHEVMTIIGNAFSHRPFCMASADGQFALGVGDTKRVRERAAKAALAVTVQLNAGFSEEYLQSLLPLARQCDAARRHHCSSHSERPDDHVHAAVALDHAASSLPPPPPPPMACWQASAANPEEDFEEIVEL